MEYLKTMKKIKTCLVVLVVIIGSTSCENNVEEELAVLPDQEVSLQRDIMPLLITQCTFSGCHNGDNGSSRDWTEKDNILAKASGIRTRTQNRSMPLSPGSLTQSEINLIASWVDDGAKDN